ncbi:MAG: hypothetical protein LBT84_06855 [Spirochaetia bacterium]|jgi:hypothetical protein|nr:hypothetical protein [Spirochaetia bacterium]
MPGNETTVEPLRFTDVTAAYMKQASPWIRFVCILSFILFGLGILGGLFSLLLAGAIETFSSIPLPSGEFLPSKWIFLSMAAVYLIVSGICLWAAILLYSYGSKIRNTHSEDDIVLAFKNFRKFLVIIGVSESIFTAAFIILVLIGFIQKFSGAVNV